MPIELVSEQTGLERKNAIDNARLFVGIIIGYSFFHTPVCFCSRARLVTLPLRTYLVEDKNNLTIHGFELLHLAKAIPIPHYQKHKK